ncbi:DNA topoisomerase IB [Amycolatopsis sp. 195334CR]|uniref:DNA topoisomerase IB n=1 Tax=Amycolatopsis sp. 195334CR TaxID=2814588 RepID=UPI001A8E28F8|nr:DNA topoisomerase IB [Amycolatopsis sp. 195334CR]MBN6039541.1 DNA topoisomerase IB [Amycolatopsis sp. 195334CR]
MLVRSEVDGPGIRRVRRGRGFGYRTEDGAKVEDKATLTRIRELVIPPAWRDVWICAEPDGHIQAVGVDDAGRRQYLYHEQWRRERDEEKHDRVLDLARRLPKVRQAVADDLARTGLGRERVLAAALRLLDRGIFRTGGEEYAEENGSHGVATLLREHVRLSGDELRFRYTAKGGADRAVSVRDPLLAKAVKALRRNDSGSERLLVHRSGRGWHEVRAEDINDRFKDLAGDEFTAKDLRTWNATVLAAAAFGREAGEKTVMKEVAEALGNTPAVTRASYVDPRVVRAAEAGDTIERAVRRARDLGDEQRRETLERAVIRLLSRADG